MQIKTTVTYTYGKGIWKILTVPSSDKDAEQSELSLIAGGNTKPYNHFGK